jgi:hypothetical protein
MKELTSGMKTELIYELSRMKIGAVKNKRKGSEQSGRTLDQEYISYYN